MSLSNVAHCASHFECRITKIMLLINRNGLTANSKCSRLKLIKFTFLLSFYSTAHHPICKWHGGGLHNLKSIQVIDKINWQPEQ